MKTIAIDATGLTHARPTGVENATRELISALLSIDRENRYLLYTPQKLPEGFEINPNTTVKVLPKRLFWNWRALGAALKKDRPDIFWTPGNFLPPNLPAKSIATIHDLAFVKHPEFYPPKNRFLQKLTVTRAIQHATKIIAVSQATKSDLLDYSHIDPNRIAVIYHGLPSSKARLTDNEAKLNLPAEFALVVGRIEPRKNPANIIKALYDMADKYPNLHLVFVGSPGHGFEGLKKLVQDLGLTGRVIFLGFVTPGQLTQLYHQAKMLLYPSLVEGFGFNILEGFASRVPVVTSKTGAMAEIAGDAAYLVDPTKPYDIAEAIDKLMSDFSLRSKLIKAGEDRVKEFSWVKAAHQLLEIINEL